LADLSGPKTAVMNGGDKTEEVSLSLLARTSHSGAKSQSPVKTALGLFKS
jgi:hypothetical protein